MPDIIDYWLKKYGISREEYEIRMARDGEVFMDESGFIDPENIKTPAVKVREDGRGFDTTLKFRIYGGI